MEKSKNNSHLAISKQSSKMSMYKINSRREMPTPKTVL